MARPLKRQIFAGRQTLAPGLRTIGWNSSRSATDLQLPAHVHPHAYEICCITRGSVEWWAGNDVYEVGPGDVYITRPGERHGGVDAVIHPCDLYWIIVTLSAARQRPLSARFAAMQARCFPGSAAVPRLFEAIMDEHREPDELSLVAARALFEQLLVTILRDHDAQVRRADRQGASPPIARAMQWMLEHLEEDYAVAEAAEIAGLSVTQFHDRFRREVGFPPGEWRTRRRIDQAKAWLRQPDKSITDVAMRTGFASSQYFATTFKKLVGLTPRAYRDKLTGRSSINAP